MPIIEMEIVFSLWKCSRTHPLSTSFQRVASSSSCRQIRNERKFDSISVPLSPDLHLNLLHTNMLHSFPAFKSFWAIRKQKSTWKEEKLNFWMKSGCPGVGWCRVPQLTCIWIQVGWGTWLGGCLYKYYVVCSRGILGIFFYSGKHSLWRQLISILMRMISSIVDPQCLSCSAN